MFTTCVCVCGYQKRASTPPQLEVVSCHGVLGTEPRCSARVTNALLNHWAISCVEDLIHIDSKDSYECACQGPARCGLKI